VIALHGATAQLWTCVSTSSPGERKRVLRDLVDGAVLCDATVTRIGVLTIQSDVVDGKPAWTVTDEVTGQRVAVDGVELAFEERADAEKWAWLNGGAQPWPA
jgi:hypothetical protein